jgi:hypothetical protein
MSKNLMKMNLHKDLNCEIQQENSELKMHIQTLEMEKQELQDQMDSHGELLIGIIQELESELQAKDQMLAQLNKVEHESMLQEKLPFGKGIQSVVPPEEECLKKEQK